MLNKVLEEMGRGLLGDRLGADVYKKRVGAGGRGKSGGVRTVVLFKKDELAVFLYGYAKNEKGNLTLNEEGQLRIFAKGFMKLSPAKRGKLVADRVLIKLKEQK